MYLSLHVLVLGLLSLIVEGYRLPHMPASRLSRLHTHISAPASLMNERSDVWSAALSVHGVGRQDEAKHPLPQSEMVSRAKGIFLTDNSADLSRRMTKLLKNMSGGDLQAFWEGFVLKSDDQARRLDLQAHTAAMSALNRHQRHETAVRTYEYFLRQRTALDAIAFTCATRAAGFCRPFAYTLQLLENAYRQLGAGCVSVAATAIINRKYMPKSATTVNEVVRVLDWLGEKKCALSANVMDSALAVVVAHGTDADCADILQRMRGAGIAPTIYSYNALLDRAARQGDETQAMSVVAQMQAGNVTADSTTYNTLLKLYVNQNNADGAVKVVRQMRDRLNLPLTDVTESLLLRLQRNAPDSKTATIIAVLLAGMPTAAARSRFVLANRIEACTDPASALALFAEAEKAQQADVAVYISVAKCLARDGDYRAAFAHIDLMMQRGVDMNAFALSFAQRITKEVQELPGDQRDLREHAFARLTAYISWCKRGNPRLLTSAVWLSTLEISLRESWECQAAVGNLAVDMLTDVYGSAREFSRGFVDLYVHHVDAELSAARRQQPGNIASDHAADQYATACGRFFTSLCRALQRDGTGNRPLTAHLSAHHFDVITRLLTAAGRHDLVPDVYWLRRLDYTTHGAAQEFEATDAEHYAAGEGVTVAPVIPPYDSTRLRPTAYAVLSGVQNARRRGDVDMAVDALTWGMQHHLLAFHVVQEAISFLYSAGRRELVEELYEQIYRTGLVCHWEGGYDFAHQRGVVSVTPAVAAARSVLDLHQYSRGMAYAAIKSAIKEMRARDTVTDLTVITGQGLNWPGKQKTVPDVSDLDEKAQRPYRLVDTVQDILIEDFYPPIHSSTVPNNPGRVVIPIA